MENKEEAIQSSKTVPVNQIDQVESDFAMALALQEQERVFSILETIAYSSNVDEDTGDDDYEEEEEDGDDEIDPDVLSYEELIALGEIIGVEKRGLSEKEISSCLVPFKYQSINECETGIDQCVICQVEYEDDEVLVALPNCKHPYHSDCISKWLQMKKSCPICSIEISSSPSSSKNATNV